MISFRVYGVPRPQGSTRAFVVKGRAVLSQGGSSAGRERLGSWRQDVAAAAHEAMAGRDLLAGPVEVFATFWLPKPKSARKDAYWVAKRPDVDKLVRSLLDSLTGVVFGDDSQVAQLAVRKLYGAEVGALVEVGAATASGLLCPSCADDVGVTAGDVARHPANYHYGGAGAGRGDHGQPLL